MDISNPTALVNAELLRLYLGKRVRTVVQVIRTDGGVVHARSADGQQLILKGTPPAPLTTFVEVIGTADSNQSIRADIWTNFGDSFGICHDIQFPELAMLYKEIGVRLICCLGAFSLTTGGMLWERV